MVQLQIGSLREFRMQEKDLSALLGTGSEFEGKLTFDGTVRIDGKFTGEIFSQGTLVVGESAQVEAQIEVGGIIIKGQVTGNITAAEFVELHAPAKLRGNLITPALFVEKGGLFDGQCQMGGDGPPADKAKSLPEAKPVTGGTSPNEKLRLNLPNIP